MTIKFDIDNKIDCILNFHIASTSEIIDYLRNVRFPNMVSVRWRPRIFTHSYLRLAFPSNIIVPNLLIGMISVRFSLIVWDRLGETEPLHDGS